MLKKSYNTILDEHLHILIAQGNHEAFVKLKRRYHYHSIKLCREILSHFEDAGVTINELMSVCVDTFVFIVSSYNPQLSSFYSYWKKVTTNEILDYLKHNSYEFDAAVFKGYISIDQEFEDSHDYSNVLSEKDENFSRKETIFEIKLIISNNRELFTEKERALLNLVLEGFSIGELEHSGVLSRSKLYLTFNSAVEKLQRLLNDKQNNH